MLSCSLSGLTAQQSLLQAELTQSQDVFNKIQGVINLYHALGGGIEPMMERKKVKRQKGKKGKKPHPLPLTHRTMLRE